MERFDFIIIGAGSAGRTAAETLALEAPSRPVLLINDELGLPYKRTKVSKSVAAGFDVDEFAVHEEDWYTENGITLLSGKQVTRIDAAQRQITVGGTPVVYGQLLLATGARPRIPFSHLPAGRWSTLWTTRDGMGLHDSLAGCRRVAVVGSGVLGVEAAWQAVQSGMETIVLGRNGRPMAQYLDADTAAHLTGKIESHGAAIKLCRSVLGIDERTDGRGLIINTEEGNLDADFAVITAGSEPEISLARSSGLDVGRGIRVDGSLRTSMPGIWAAGDCAEHPDGFISGLWHSAEHQGRWAAKGMLGVDSVYSPPAFRLKCEAFGGLWFSAGPVNAPPDAGGLEAAESWVSGHAIWRPRFRDGHLAALSGASDIPMEKSALKKIQGLLLEGADREACRDLLTV